MAEKGKYRDRGTSFWLQECPARGVGLTHKHASTCAIDHNGIHPFSTCCSCGEDEYDGPSKATKLAAADIGARLQQLLIEKYGRTTWNGGGAPNYDSETEPMAITGFGPLGPDDGVGRGPLTEEDKRRLLYEREIRKDIEP
jgi:hypothetical protein